MQSIMISSAPDHGDVARAHRVAYVSLQDRSVRERITRILEREGWSVIPKPSGFHLLQAIACVIEGHQPTACPDLIVVDARSRGCAGTTIAVGLRELGITIPIVVVAAGEATQRSPDDAVWIVDRFSAPAVVAKLAALHRWSLAPSRRGTRNTPVAREIA